MSQQQHSMSRQQVQQVQQAIQTGIEKADPKTLYAVCNELGKAGNLQMNGQSIAPVGIESDWQKGDQFQFTQQGK